MNTSQRVRPSAIHLMGAGVVLVSCELFMAAIWAFLAMRDVREIMAEALPPALLLIAIAAFVAWKQYQATFLRNAKAASTITQLLVFAVVMISIPLFDLMAMSLGIKDPKLKQGVYVLSAIWLTALFAAATNWSWSSQLRGSQTPAIQSSWQWSLGNMLAAMTVLGVQFGIASVLMRYWRG